MQIREREQEMMDDLIEIGTMDILHEIKDFEFVSITTRHGFTEEHTMELMVMDGRFTRFSDGWTFKNKLDLGLLSLPMNETVLKRYNYPTHLYSF